MSRETPDVHRATELRRHKRVEAVVQALFPRHDARAPEVVKPVRHPIKRWWWNGASIVGHHELEAGGEHVKVSSCVGGGESETFEFEIPAAWMNAEEALPLVHAWCIAESRKVADKERDRKAAAAKRNVEYAAQRLERLGVNAL